MAKMVFGKKRRESGTTSSSAEKAMNFDSSVALESGTDNVDNKGAIPKRYKVKKNSKSKEEVNKEDKSSSRKGSLRGRFSLRRLFISNPLFSDPFMQNPLSTRFVQQQQQVQQYSSRNMNRSSGRTPRSSIRGSGNNDDTNSWRSDNASCDSSAHCCNAPTFIGPDGNVIRECPLCLSRVPVDQFPQLRNCNHLFCIECLQTYVKIEIQEGRGNLKCPQCVAQMHPNDVEYLIGDQESNLLKLYEGLMLRRFLSIDPDARWCPGPNCTYAVIATGCASCPKISCMRPGCGYSFCYHCKAEWHPNQTCDMARASRTSGIEMLRASLMSFNQESGLQESKLCPRCKMIIVKLDDGSCNHMTCVYCEAEFCWLCLKEVSDLHYLSPSGCTFWGKKTWSRKKILMWQLGTLVGAPVGIALLAGISIPAMIIGLPVWVGRKLYTHYSTANKHKRNLAIMGGVTGAVMISPFLAALSVSVGVPILLAYVYGVVPISLCRSQGCGLRTSKSGVKIDVDEDMQYRPMAVNPHVPNPSIGEVSLGASLSLGSAYHLEDRLSSLNNRLGTNSIHGVNSVLHEESDPMNDYDRESASNTAIAGTSRTISLASSYVMPSSNSNFATKLEVGADVHAGNVRKKLSLSTERLSCDGASSIYGIDERSTTISLGDNDGSASTRGLAGSILAYRMDTQSVGSHRSTGAVISTQPAEASSGTGPNNGPLHGVATCHSDALSLKSLPSHVNGHQRSMSPVSNQSGVSEDVLAVSTGAVSKKLMKQQRRPHLDKQISETGSQHSSEETDHVRFDSNVSVYIEERRDKKNSVEKLGDKMASRNKGGSSSNNVTMLTIDGSLSHVIRVPESNES